MRLLLDQGLPRSSVLHLRDKGIEAIHVGDKGLATAADSKILDCGRQEGLIVVTLDADFHALLALAGLCFGYRPRVAVRFFHICTNFWPSPVTVF